MNIPKGDHRRVNLYTFHSVYTYIDLMRRVHNKMRQIIQIKKIDHLIWAAVKTEGDFPVALYVTLYTFFIYRSTFGRPIRTTLSVRKGIDGNHYMYM